MNIRNSPFNFGRVAAVSAVVVSGALAGVVGVSALVAADRSIPHSLRVDSTEHRAIVEIARTSELVGLSPASLAPRTDDLADRAAELEAIAEYARANGITGLSPTSLRPVSPGWQSCLEQFLQSSVMRSCVTSPGFDD
jgi:hypothetical protein